MKQQVRRSKYTTYSKFSTYLSRLSLPHASKLATFLLTTFITSPSEAIIKSEDVVLKGFCAKGKFTEWRDKLITLQILTWKMQGKVINHHNRYQASFYSPGVKIMKYINEEKLKTQIIATMNDLSTKADKHLVNDLQERLEKLENKYEMFQQAFFKQNPPDTKERRRQLEESIHRDLRLIQ